ncbi:MAG TPA: hypothetical protein VKT82_02305 [Ktedonobacterales bacterium]|nr:hypothetical protein [Ktedonobacterales bacterium]
MGWGFIVQWLFVLCGFVWVGGVLYVNVVLLPPLIIVPLDQLRTIGSRVGSLTRWVFMPAAVLVIALGVLHSTLFDPKQSGGILFAAYGMPFLLAFLATVGTIAWGMLVSRSAIRRLHRNPSARFTLADGKASTSIAAQLQRVKLLSGLELLGFFASFACFTCLLLIGMSLS